MVYIVDIPRYSTCVLSMFHNNITVCSASWAGDGSTNGTVICNIKSNIIYAQIIEEGNYEGMIGGR